MSLYDFFIITAGSILIYMLGMLHERVEYDIEVKKLLDKIDEKVGKL